MPKRGKITLIACEPCRRKKVRCDGARPVCGACKDRSSGLKCNFAILPGLSRTAALKSEVAQLKASNCGLVDLYWQLKHGSESEAWRIVERIRSEDTVIELPSRGDERTTSMSASGDAHHFVEAVRPAVLMDPQTVNSDPRESTTEESNTVSPANQSSQRSVDERSRHEGNDDRALQESLLSNMDKIREGFRIQRLCISEIFFCHNSQAFEALAINLELGRGLCVTKSALCEICAMAATSGQYVRDEIEPSILDYWYDAAKQRFDDCIQTSPVRAVRTAALMGLYNLLNKSTVAFAYFGMGLSLAARYLKDPKAHKELQSAEEVSSVVHTLRSLEFCNGWLQATLDYISSSSGSSAVGEENAFCCENEHDLVHAAMSSIAVLKAATMRTLWTCSDIPNLLTSIQNLQRQLREWYERLPLTAQLGQIGAVMLIFRHGLAGLQSPEDRAALSVQQKKLFHDVLDDGIVAAQQSLRMIYLLRASSQNVRHCWITIYQAYVSGMIILYHATQLRLIGCAEKSWEGSIDAAAKAVEVLNFCGELDPIARKFAEALSLHFDCLRSATSHIGVKGQTQPLPPRSGDYLFKASSENSQLHESSCQLFTRLCNPYTDEYAMAAKLEEEDVDPRLRPSMTRPSAGSKRAPNAAAISNMEDGTLSIPVNQVGGLRHVLRSLIHVGQRP